jgi:hypothetical protein
MTDSMDNEFENGWEGGGHNTRELENLINKLFVVEAPTPCLGYVDIQVHDQKKSEALCRRTIRAYHLRLLHPVYAVSQKQKVQNPKDIPPKHFAR